MDGNLRRRANGNWQYRTTYGTTPDHRQRARSHTFPNSKEWALTRAKKEARKIRVAWDEEANATANTDGTVGKLVADWAATRRNQSPTTEYRNRAILNAITQDLGKIQLANLTALDIDRWYIKLAQTRSPNTVRHYHRVLRAILQQGMKWKLVAGNEATLATPPDPERHDQTERMPTLAAITLMLSKANRTLRMAVLLAAATGARRGEIVGLRWSDIDRDGVLTIQRSLFKLPGGRLEEKGTKTGMTPRVPLNPALLAELARFRAESVVWCESVGATLVEDGPILAHLRTDPTGATPFAPDWLSQEWERLCRRAGVAPFKLHGTRHLMITSLHDAGVPSAAIASRVGHASIATTEGHYTHAQPAAELEAGRNVIETVFAPLFTPKREKPVAVSPKRD